MLTLDVSDDFAIKSVESKVFRDFQVFNFTFLLPIDSLAFESELYGATQKTSGRIGASPNGPCVPLFA